MYYTTASTVYPIPQQPMRQEQVLPRNRFFFFLCRVSVLSRRFA
jgi:hypothetical protein